MTPPSAGARRLIALLREYRARLIADVVTGQLDVRAAAKSPAPTPPVILGGGQNPASGRA